MRKETEEEFKFLVSYEQYRELLSKCGMKYPFVKEVLQVNYYYDTEAAELNKSKTTVRVRQQNEKLMLEIKRHKNPNSVLSTSDEYSCRIDTLPKVLRIPNVRYPLVLKGVLITGRRMFSFGGKSVICFDSNVYLGCCDYEIEIEFAKTDTEEALRVIDYLGIGNRSIASKSERFFERLNAINNEGDMSHYINTSKNNI